MTSTTAARVEELETEVAGLRNKLLEFEKVNKEPTVSAPSSSAAEECNA